MDIDKFLESKLFKAIIIGIFLFIILLFVFRVGMFVGSRRADFAFKWGENYHRNFAGPRQGFFNEFMGKDFIDANGVFGQIIKIDGQTIVVKGKDDVEKIVLANDNAIIKRQRSSIKLSELKIDDNIVVIGEPNIDGQIQAKLIRVMPPQRQNPPANNSPINLKNN